MDDYPNPDWRSRWTVNLETATVTHCDGWVFKFCPDQGDAGAFNAECLEQPTPLMAAHLSQAASVAREAGDIYIEARHARH
jgi:hypothetical protein